MTGNDIRQDIETLEHTLKLLNDAADLIDTKLQVIGAIAAHSSWAYIMEACNEIEKLKRRARAEYSPN